MYILFDIGGTKMRVVGTSNLETFQGEPIVLDTPASFDEGLTLLKSTIAGIASGESVEAIAGGIAGPFDQSTGMLVGSPNLPDWIGKPLVEKLSAEYSAPIYIQNDTALVGLGEMHFGSGEAEGIVVYLTVSTGVGGARFIDGVIDESTIGFEPGHQIIDAGKALCPDCVDGTLESYIGGGATEKRMGKKAYEIKDKLFWDRYAQFLAYGLVDTIAYWSPKAIILGGSMIVGDPAISVEKAKKYLKKSLTIFPTLPEIRKASLGELGGLYGAMAYISQLQQ